MRILVTDTGALGNGVVKDTQAVQKAIDLCAGSGGGEVVFPAGTYLLGKVLLKSCVTVTLETGCEIVASSEKCDYPRSNGPVDSHLVASDGMLQARYAVFYGCDLHHVVFRGKGRLNGNFQAMLAKQKKEFTESWIDHGKDYEIYAANGFRCVLFYLENCTDISVEEVHFYHAPGYTLHFRSCSFLKIQGIRIENYLGANNSDGIHLCSCSDVRISDCDLCCGDDAIAIDANNGKTAEHFVITNCIFTSRNNCFRIYTGLLTPGEGAVSDSARVRDVLIYGCMVRRADSFLCINADHGEISDIQAIGIGGTVIGCGTAFIVSAHNGAKVHRVKLSGWKLTAHGAGYLYAETETNSCITDISASDFDLWIEPVAKLYGCGMKKMTKVPHGVTKDVPIYWTSHLMPYFLQIIHVENLSLKQIKIRWGEEKLDGMETMETSAGQTVIEHFTKLCGWPEPESFTLDWPAVQLVHTKNAVLCDMDVLPHGNMADAIQIIT